MAIGVINNLTEEQLDDRYSVGDDRNNPMETNEDTNDTLLDSLSAHIKTQFETNRDDRTTMEQTMLSLLESMANKYDPETLSQINAMGGSKLFMPLTSQQVSGAVSWLNSILNNGWSITNTPLPELPESIKTKLMEEVKATLKGPQTPKGPDGIPLGADGGPMGPREASDITKVSQEDAIKKISEAAKQRSKKMSTLIEDQLVDSNWDRTLKEFTNDLGVFPSAFIKTTYKKRVSMKTTNTDNKFSMVPHEDLVAIDERVHPLDMFPSPDQTDINNGSLIERMKLSRKSIYDSIGLPGYREDNIRKVLKDFDKDGLSEWQTTVDNARRIAEGHSWGFGGLSDGSITSLRFMGPVTNKELLEWHSNIPEDSVDNYKWIADLDPDGDTEIDAILVSSYIIKIVPNVDPTGSRKYYMSSYRKIPGSFWGTSPAMLVAPHQRLVNATCRALSNNMGIASGPMAYVLIDRLPQGEDLGSFHPWKTYQMTSDPSGANIPPINFFQPNDNSTNLLSVYQYYMEEAYSVSGVPRGAMEGPTSRMSSGDHTASGIASELESASKAIKLAASNIEQDVVIPRIKDQYRTNMLYHEDDSVKGDFDVVALGSSSSIAKAVDTQQAIELLNAIAGGPGIELVGLEGLGSILGRIAKNSDMPNLIPSEEEIKQRQEEQSKQKPPPTDAQVKLQIETIRAETRIKDQELEDRNAEAERNVRLQIAQMELEMKKMDMMHKQQLASKSEQQQKEVTALQGMNANARAKDANETKLVLEQMKLAAKDIV